MACSIAPRALAQEIGRQYCIPVFLKTFGSDEHYDRGKSDDQQTVYVSEDMTRRMAQLPTFPGWPGRSTKAVSPTIFRAGIAGSTRPLPLGRADLNDTGH